jgi:tetratricopeptide (TPR) repeat protein
MNSTGPHARPRTFGFDERLSVLVEELELAVKWQRPCILLAVYNSDFVRGDVETALKTRLMDLGQKRVKLSLENRKPAELPDLFKQIKNPRRTVIEIDGFRHANGSEADVYAALNRQREYFIERRIRNIFWLTEKELAELAHAAPEFWAHRDRVVEFIQMPKTDQAQATDSARHGVATAAAEPKEPDARIPAREPVLPLFAREEQSLATRGNLLLGSSVQNWRKGDFAKADELLQEALKLTTSLRDNKFEAECFNALALLRNSMHRIDEAVDAYKRSLQLAPGQISIWNSLGTLCADAGRNDEAMIAFRKALQLDPRDGIAWNGLANVHLKAGYHEDAIVAYRKAIQYTHSFAQPWLGLGNVYAGIGRSDEAEKSYRKAIELDKQFAAPWIQLGGLFKRQASYREAAKAYLQAVELEPSNADAWNELGTAQMEADSLDEAAAAFSRAIEIDRGKGSAYGNLALIYMRQNKHKEAVSLLLRSIELLEGNAEKAAAWNQLGSVYRALNDYDNAVAAYQMADEFATLDDAFVETPVEPPAEVQQAAVDGPAVDEANPDVPADAVQVAIESIGSADAPSSAEFEHPDAAAAAQDEKQSAAPAWLFQRAATPEATQSEGVEPSRAASMVSDVEAPVAAAADANEGPAASEPMAASEPAEQPAENLDAAGWTERGNALFNRGSFEEAIAAYNSAVQVDPTYGPAYGNLALAYLTKGQGAEAILLYQKSIEYLTSDADKAISWNGLGNAYRRIGDYAHAVSAYQKAAELDPETSGIRDRADDFESAETPKNAQAWNDLGDVLLKTGSADKAAEAFRRAIELEPQGGVAFSGLARALAAQGKHREALPFFQRSIELLKDDNGKAHALNGMGNSYRKLNDYESAIRSYQKAGGLTDDGMSLLTRARFSLLSNVYVNP